MMMMRGAAGRLLVSAAILVAHWAAALAGHEVGFYPSYYPDEIRIDSLRPAAAAARFGDSALHAYVGAFPEDVRLPDRVRTVESLGSLLVLGFNPDIPAFASAGGRCTAARRILAALRDAGGGFVFNPYPVTPYHADYLHHLDRIEEARAVIGAERSAAPAFVFRATGAGAEALVRGRWPIGSDQWQVSLEEVPLPDLMAMAGPALNGWSGAPWVREGWYQAYHLLAPSLVDETNRRAADAAYRDLAQGAYLSLAERLDLERRLLGALTRGCSRVVVGYVPRHEVYDGDYDAGIENVGYDSQTGLNAPVFIRTAKLKGYPWNGSLALGLGGGFEAAWNPVGGFTDAAGGLIWAAAGDPALIAFPQNSSWLPNRVNFTLERAKGQSGGFAVPGDTLRPQAGTGLLEPVPPPAFASAKLTYEVIASPFLDGTETGTADLLYAYAFAFRWGAEAGPDDPAFDPRVAAATAEMRARLVGVRPLRVDTFVNKIAPDVEIVQQRPVLEVYLADTPGDPQQVAALAPPWSTVPWHLLALMEETVLRGHTAFTEEAAKRRGVGWLDLVRDPAMLETMRALIGEFEKSGYRPPALRALVSEGEAHARWQALAAFAAANGHLLVTNGPYRLAAWQPGAVILKAVREATYPLGFGTFDRHVQPLRAVLREVAREGDAITVRVDAEKTVSAGRETRLEVAPLSRTTARGTYGALVASRYLLIGPHGDVVAADKMHWEGDDRFRIALPGDLAPGRYTALVAVYLDQNALTPSTGLLRFEVPD